MDPLRAVADLIVGLHRTGKLNRWCELIFAMGFSFWTSGAFACGTALVAGKPWLFALGTGLLSGAGAMAFLFWMSPLTKNIAVALPKDLQIADPNYQGFEKSK